MGREAPSWKAAARGCSAAYLLARLPPLCRLDCAPPPLPLAAVNDPLLSEDARELLAALAAAPACLPALQARALPTLCGIVGAPAGHSAILVDGALELITMVLGPSPPEAAARIHAAATPAALALLACSDDAEVLRSATSYLRTLLQARPARPATALPPHACAARLRCFPLLHAAASPDPCPHPLPAPAGWRLCGAGVGRQRASGRAGCAAAAGAAAAGPGAGGPRL